MNKKENMEFCPFCRKRHNILQVEVEQKDLFHNQEISYLAQYEYCETTGQQWANEGQLKKNSVRLKDAYRKSVGLLSSEEIKSIRKKYKISQEALASILGWGKKTITRYETVSIQDQVHDDVLRKIGEDPLWFFDFVTRSKDTIDRKLFDKYTTSVSSIYQNLNFEIAKKSLFLEYYYLIKDEKVGNVQVNPNRIENVVNYFAMKIPELSKNKATRLLLLADFMHYCKYDFGITGLAYTFERNYILPKGHEVIFNLEGIHMTEIMENDHSMFRIEPNFTSEMSLLNKLEINTLDAVIKRFERLNEDDYFDKLNSAAKSTIGKAFDYIPYNIACDLELTLN